MIKLIACDLDGTLLLNGTQRLPKDIFPLIRKLKEMGILFAAASGRQYANLHWLFAPVKDDMAFVSENGTMTVQNDRVLYQDGFDRELVVDILRAIHEKDGADFTCSTKDFYYMMPKTREFLKMVEDEVHCSCKVISGFDEITEPCMKAAVFEKEGLTEESIRFWQERFGSRCKVVTSGFAWIDFIPFTANKAKGIRALQEVYGISDDECMAFGDEYNDVEMLQAVKYGFAMSHSKPGVLAAAHYQTDRVETVLEKVIAAGGEIRGIFPEKSV